MGTWFGLVVALYGIPLVIYLAFAVPALLALRSRALDDTATAMWALTIVAIPVMGAAAFAFLNPGIRTR